MPGRPVVLGAAFACMAAAGLIFVLTQERPLTAETLFSNGLVACGSNALHGGADHYVAYDKGRIAYLDRHGEVRFGGAWDWAGCFETRRDGWRRALVALPDRQVFCEIDWKGEIHETTCDCAGKVDFTSTRPEDEGMSCYERGLRFHRKLTFLHAKHFNRQFTRR